MKYQNIHIGTLINQMVIERGIDSSRICNFLKVKENEINFMYKSKNLDTETLLKWSKLLDYDFFRIYSQHLILFSPQSNTQYNQTSTKQSSLPKFRKSVYTKEVIDFILEKIESEQMTKKQVMERYKIPKTTLYKWILKYKK